MLRFTGSKKYAAAQSPRGPSARTRSRPILHQHQNQISMKTASCTSLKTSVSTVGGRCPSTRFRPQPAPPDIGTLLQLHTLASGATEPASRTQCPSASCPHSARHSDEMKRHSASKRVFQNVPVPRSACNFCGARHEENNELPCRQPATRATDQAARCRADVAKREKYDSNESCDPKLLATRRAS